jgi:hypothetical protein
VSAYTAYDASRATTLPADYRKSGDTLYRGDDPAAPTIGDIKIRTAAPSQTMMSSPRRPEYVGAVQRGQSYWIALAEPVSSGRRDVSREAQEESLLT